jgi:hypothetical protein
MNTPTSPLRGMSRLALSGRAGFAGLGLLTMLAAAPPCDAQPTTTTRPIEGTVGDLLRSARASARVAGFADTMPQQFERLQRQLDALGRTSLDTLRIDAVARASMASRDAGRASLWRVARWNSREAIAVLTPTEGAALDSLARITLQFLPDLLERRVSADSTDALLAPISAFNRARLTESLAQSLEKLRRYERKFGPQSPKLNAAEVALNFVAQSVPPFRPSADGWPSAFEVVASYVPTYLTERDGRVQAWTVLEAGLRRYSFGDGWGEDGWAGVLRPGHVSAGVAIVNGGAGAMGEPWRGDNRLGAFLAWGSAKIAVVGGEGPRVLITRQVQVIPFVF